MSRNSSSSSSFSWSSTKPRQGSENNSDRHRRSTRSSRSQNSAIASSPTLHEQQPHRSSQTKHLPKKTRKSSVASSEYERSDSKRSGTSTPSCSVDGSIVEENPIHDANHYLDPSSRFQENNIQDQSNPPTLENDLFQLPNADPSNQWQNHHQNITSYPDVRAYATSASPDTTEQHLCDYLTAWEHLSAHVVHPPSPARRMSSSTIPDWQAAAYEEGISRFDLQAVEPVAEDVEGELE